MSITEKYKIPSQILLWWSSWIIVSSLLTNSFDHPNVLVIRGIASLIGIAIIVAVNIKYLLPQFYFQKRLVAFAITGVIMVGVVTLVLYSDSDYLPWSDWFNTRPTGGNGPRRGGEGMRPPRVKWMGRLTPLIIAFLGSTLVEVARFANRKEKEAIHSEKEKLETELKFLKSQVNPHFLFNALNNIYSLAVLQAPQTPESVMQLSEILRYMVYDSNEPKVPLKSEINYIENFVELQLLKDSRGMDVKLDLDQSAANPMIAPLLFVPFVENAFKHSKIESLKDGFINIQLRVEENEITFRVVNSVPEVAFTKDEVGGVGLENTKKRLELLYPNGLHQLSIKESEQQFEVILKLTV